MFGVLRFILALIVVLNHIPYNHFSFDLAVAAVILFYLITGHLMSLKAGEYRLRTSHPMLLFWADRFLRIYPPYLCVLTLTVVLVRIWGPSQALAPGRGTMNAACNYLLLPTNYFMFIGDGSSMRFYIPQGFSLALEEQFYILLPLLLAYRRMIPAVAAASLSVVAYLIVLLLHHGPITKMTGDYMIYRLLPGTLPIFILGSILANKSFAATVTKALIVAAYAALFVTAQATGSIGMFQILPVCLGIVVGYAVVMILMGIRRNRVDDLIGRGAYGTFLIHFTVIWWVQKFVYPSVISNVSVAKILIATLSVAGGFLVYGVVERPMNRLRRRFIGRFIARYPAGKAEPFPLSGRSIENS